MNRFRNIQQKLQQIEGENQIKILLAVESGSRAWGFPSLDSDYDVRAIFIRPQQDYLVIQPPKETFEYIENIWFDVGGWDICKSLNLLRKSNSVLFEWINSPIVYCQHPPFLKQIKSLSNQYFQVGPTVRHYRGVAKNALNTLDLNQQIKLKKWFYALRSLLAALWAIKQGTVPPVELSKLYQSLSKSLVDEINELVAFKAQQEESYLHQLSPCLIKLTIDLANELANMTLSYPNNETSVEPLNRLFRHLLAEE